jgi:8-oxo-dGTP diphosphatase
MKEDEFRKMVKELRIAIAAVDVVIFSIVNDTLHVFLTPIHRPPHYINMFGLPGGVILEKESADDAAIRHLTEKANVKGVSVDQLYTFSSPDRDKRSRSISIAYLALLPSDKYENIQNENGVWVSVDKLPALAYDHAHIIKIAIERLRGKIIYTNVVKDLLPVEFTLPELQRVYEVLLEHPLDKRNFRKKFLNTKLIKEVNDVRRTKRRPAQLYTFSSNKLEIIPEVWAAL